MTVWRVHPVVLFLFTLAIVAALPFPAHAPRSICSPEEQALREHGVRPVLLISGLATAISR